MTGVLRGLGETQVLRELAVHPLQPHLLVMITESGLAVYEAGAKWTPAAAVQPKGRGNDGMLEPGVDALGGTPRSVRLPESGRG